MDERIVEFEDWERGIEGLGAGEFAGGVSGGGGLGL